MEASDINKILTLAKQLGYKATLVTREKSHDKEHGFEYYEYEVDYNEYEVNDADLVFYSESEAVCLEDVVAVKVGE